MAKSGDSRALTAQATVKDAKVKTHWRGSATLLTLGLELELPKPEPIKPFKQWRKLGHWEDGPKYRPEEPKAKKKKGEPEPSEEEKARAEQERERELEKEYGAYVARRTRENNWCILAAQKAAVFLTLLGSKVNVSVSPMQGEMFLFDSPALLDAGPEPEDEPEESWEGEDEEP